MLKKWIVSSVLTLWLFSVSITAIAQDTSTTKSSAAATSNEKVSKLADAWLGVWKGKAQSISPAGVNVTFDMQIEIKLLNDPSRYEWKTVFSGPQGDVVKAYELIPQTKINHFVIDEKNSILIDATLLGDTLSSHFTVQDQTIWCQYHLAEEQGETYLTFDLYSASSSNAKSSGAKDGIPEVKSVIPTTRQTARLKKQKS